MLEIPRAIRAMDSQLDLIKTATGDLSSKGCYDQGIYHSVTGHGETLLLLVGHRSLRRLHLDHPEDEDEDDHETSSF